ncbi:hypothetical protein QUF64_08805 [Anaerolineales bacterium HSG6]|nr:hypothetical protein [Anaerolineales bacterium HSG6]
MESPKICGGQDDVGVRWVQPLLLATAKPVALHFQHQPDHHRISKNQTSRLLTDPVLP